MARTFPADVLQAQVDWYVALDRLNERSAPPSGFDDAVGPIGDRWCAVAGVRQSLCRGVLFGHGLDADDVEELEAVGGVSAGRGGEGDDA
ncbi:hypothetical protein GCM10009802_13350 [Streptomyces synnematoformans]|uniref:Uncharacterized protein n=1 Tax=Streptomyces synnematoformans TaxID=415721 RepID=A0ABP5J9R0_9ACTN